MRISLLVSRLTNKPTYNDHDGDKRMVMGRGDIAVRVMGVRLNKYWGEVVFLVAGQLPL